VNYQDLVERWKGLPHKTRKNIRLAAVVGGLGLVSAAVVHTTRNRLDGPANAKDTSSSTVLLAPAANLNTQNLAATVSDLTKQVSAMRANLAESNGMTEKQIAAYLQAHPVQPAADTSAPGGGGAADAAQIKDLQAQLKALQAQVAARPAVSMPSALPSTASPTPAAPTAPQLYEVNGSGGAQSSAQISQVSVGTGTQQDAGVPAPPKSPDSMQGGAAGSAIPTRAQVGRATRQVKDHPGKNAIVETVSVNDKDKIYLPAGTIITAVTLNGVNVGTGPAAQSNPQIVDMRVKHDAIMPNGYRVNLSNCMTISTGSGNLAAQRVYLRPTALSCVNDQGKVIEAAIKGYVVGDDGIAGLKGVVVDHQGALLAKGFLAGMFSGLGNAFSPTSVTPLQINPSSTTQYQTPSGSQVVGGAVAGGVNNAAGLIAQFYIQEAKSLQPTLQINPGVSGDIILETGSYVKKAGLTKAELEKTGWEANSEGAATPTQAAAAQANARQAIGQSQAAATAPAAQ
jgi:conjugal transfer pilus assembly protein TraB